MTSKNFVPLIGFENDYAIMTEYPFDIKDLKHNTMNYGVATSRDGIIVNLNGKKYKKHNLIAKQFLPNPNNKKLVFHINGNMLDNTLNNLTWNRYELKPINFNQPF